jgi:hypothetical protein
VNYRSLRGQETHNARRAAVGRTALAAYLAELSGSPARLSDDELAQAAGDVVIDLLHMLDRSIEADVSGITGPALLDRAESEFKRERLEGAWEPRPEFAR